MTSKTFLVGALAGTAVLLASCGGGGGGSSDSADPPVAASDVPLSATTSSAGALAFVKRVAAMDNSATPIVVGDAVLATSDTDEPDAGI
jgi:hypothetical protein